MPPAGEGHGGPYPVPMFRTRSLALLVPLALALAVAGCSSSEDGSEDASSSSSSSTTEATADDGTTEEEAEDAGSDTAGEAGADVSADDAVAICAALEALSEFDAQSTEIVASGDWPATQEFYVEQTQTVLDAYDEAIATGSELSDELTQLRAVTAPAAELAASSTDLMDFGTKLLDVPGMTEAAGAAVTLDAFAQETCGVSTGGN